MRDQIRAETEQQLSGSKDHQDMRGCVSPRVSIHTRGAEFIASLDIHGDLMRFPLNTLSPSHTFLIC